MGHNPIRNTTKDVYEGGEGLLILAEAMGGKSTGTIIEDMEKRGQQQVAAAGGTKLPTEGSDNPAWAKMGVVFGEPVEGDPLFRDATVPQGWRVKATGHSMWSDLVDDKDRKRGSIFYKAAFYDRGAHIHVLRRFSVHEQYSPPPGYETIAAYVHDTNLGDCEPYNEAAVVFRVEAGPDDRPAFGESTSRKACADWLDEHYPNWADASSYWDE